MPYKRKHVSFLISHQDSSIWLFVATLFLEEIWDCWMCILFFVQVNDHGFPFWPQRGYFQFQNGTLHSGWSLWNITLHEAFSCWVFSWNWNYLLPWDPLCFEKTSFLSSTYLLQGSFFAEIATGFVKDLKSISFGVRHLCEHKKPQKNTLSCVSNVCIFMLKKKMGRSISGQGKNKKLKQNLFDKPLFEERNTSRAHFSGMG